MLTTAAAEQLGIKRTTVLKHLSRGLLKGTKDGRDWQISQREVNRYNRQRKGPGRPKK
jgi:excisionase family DNA binding protein